MVGKNLINQTLREQKKLITQTKMMMLLKKNIKVGKVKNKLVYFTTFLFLLFCTNLNSENDLEGNYTNIKILDKISSKNFLIKLKNGENFRYKDLLIKSIKCKNSEFDDSPEITAYLQVKDLSKNQDEKVFIFNGWTFSSDPSITPFDHAIYDLQLVNCSNS